MVGKAHQTSGSEFGIEVRLLEASNWVAQAETSWFSRHTTGRTVHPEHFAERR